MMSLCQIFSAPSRIRRAVVGSTVLLLVVSSLGGVADEVLPAADVDVFGASLTIQTFVPHQSSSLLVAGPAGYALTLQLDQPYADIAVDLVGEAEQPAQQDAPATTGEASSVGLSAGAYHYEFTLYDGRETIGRASGSFAVGDDGQTYQPLSPVDQIGVDAELPGDASTANFAVELWRRLAGSLLDWLMPVANASDSTTVFYSITNPSGTGQSRLNLTGSSALLDDDTWRLRNNASAGFRFELYDESADLARITALQNGNVGIGTTAPQDRFHVAGGNIRITPFFVLPGTPSWILNPGTSGLWFNTSSGRNVLKLENDAPTDSIVATPTGVGIGTNIPAPGVELNVVDDINTQLEVRNTAVAGPGNDQVMFRLEAQGNDKIRFALAAAGGSSSWTFDNTPTLNEFSISRVGTGVNEFTVNGVGDGRFRGVVRAQGFLTVSSREAKTSIEQLDQQAVLAKVLQLPILQWQYKDDVSRATHIGPMADDFKKLFGLGTDQHISLSDLSGITLASLKGLYTALQQRDTELQQLRDENTKLADRLASLERLVLSRQTLSQR